MFAGRSIGELTRELNERGQAGERAALPVSGKLWSRQVLPVMLTRPALAGLLYHKGEEYGVIKGIEPIVAREEWERMKALVAARKTGKPPAPRHPLSGEIMCGRCGRSRMYGTVRSDGRPGAAHDRSNQPREPQPPLDPPPLNSVRRPASASRTLRPLRGRPPGAP
jgi:hypothetical protein